MSHTNPSTQYFNTPGNNLQRELDRHVKAYAIDFNCPVCGLKRGHPHNHTKCSKILQARYNANKSNV
jgi:hypothetical protein